MRPLEAELNDCETCDRWEHCGRIPDGSKACYVPRRRIDLNALRALARPWLGGGL